MTDSPMAAAQRRLSAIEADLRKAASLHGVFAAGLVLIGLFLPLVEVQLNADTSVSFTPLELLFLVAEYEVDHPVVLVVAALILVATALTAGVAFLATAAWQSRLAARVSMLASITLVPVVLAAGSVLSFVDILEAVNEPTGPDFDPFEVWNVAAWILLVGGLVGAWIGAVLRSQLEL